MGKITFEVAQKDIDNWLDFKRVNQRKRETYKDQIERLVEAVMEGVLIHNSDNTLTQKLMFPAESEQPVTELVYKPRLKLSDIHTHLKNVKPTDADGRMFAYIAALTSQATQVVRSIDTEDYSIATAIAVFFA